ncbi:hypothetical protein Poli38472_003138 [Pythium oligandrum]|uniref:Presenilin n=1 Tax=Pythium oligandrum TaxID=41045 RepID=A0A8K1C697_PYTOL|nr:hypothetical protein Poli38472_003138 [Pythium oligandrum]|eukprot:TMW57213.1 hypothetical protein Poli38472_003138 [Pythium oligandrum]
MSPPTMPRGERLQNQDDDTVVIPVADSTASSQGYDKLTTPNGTDAPASRSQSQKQNEDVTAQTEDLMHGINSFWAIVYPVCITMLVASVVVVNYRNKSIEASMQTYLVFGNAEQKGGAETFGLSLVNALVIIGAIALLTFGMALLYKFNCVKFLTGYIMFASTAILSFVGGQLIDSVINDQFQWAVDWPSFLYVMINFGVVGVISIFYQKGTSKFIQNGYLVMVSVILAWEFSMWPMWTTLIFCFMFAIYDLCAVLTPCGPLKCLIALIQEKQAPLPGLIYEADVRDGVSHEAAQANRNKGTTGRTSSQTSAASSRSSNPPQPEQPRQLHSEPRPQARSQPRSEPRSEPRSQPRLEPRSEPRPVDPRPAPVPGRPRNVAESDFTTHECETMEELIELLKRFYETFSPEDTWKAQQVADKFFATQDRLWYLIFHKYYVCSCSMDIPCPVQARHEARARRQQEEDEDDKTIKLGLGDFIFYSVLVGRAAIFDFSTFAAAFLCIVMGLGGTLFLLSVLHKALPALPISIFLATFFYFWTQYLFVDFCDFVMSQSAAV